MNDLHLLLVEDDARTAETIRAILCASGFSTIYVADTVASARPLLADTVLGGLLVDLSLPDGDGLELIESVRARSPALPILVITSSASHHRVVTALRAGADGFLFKDDIDLRLGKALCELLSGGAPLSAGAAAALLREYRSQNDFARAPSLTVRQREVLALLATGAGYAEIAHDLRIGINTVRSHVMSLYAEMGVENRAEAVNLAWRFGLLQRSAQ